MWVEQVRDILLGCPAPSHLNRWPFWLTAFRNGSTTSWNGTQRSTAASRRSTSRPRTFGCPISSSTTSQSLKSIPLYIGAGSLPLKSLSVPMRRLSFFFFFFPPTVKQTRKKNWLLLPFFSLFIFHSIIRCFLRWSRTKETARPATIYLTFSFSLRLYSVCVCSFVVVVVANGPGDCSPLVV